MMNKNNQNMNLNKNIPVIDFHCDVLSKLQQEPTISFVNGDQLDMSYEKMKAGNIALQCFAIYISEKLGPASFSHIDEQIQIFYEQVVHNGIFPIRNKQELLTAKRLGHIGGILSIEGADGLAGNFNHLEQCYERGVRFLGLTWNYANWAADGVLEPRNDRLTERGVQLVHKCHELGMIMDVSHLSTNGFWHLSEMAHEVNKPFIASHSNAIEVCGNVRNLSDEQILDIISLEGRIGLNFYPPFVTSEPFPTVKSLLPHIEHICELGGQKHMMMGADFDGIEQHLAGLTDGACYPDLTELLLRYYDEDLVRDWMYNNAYSFLESWLPY
jgi:membrane dipeptidase